MSGGVSVGPYDVVRAAFEAFGTVDLWRVAVQPGKPFAFGTGRAPGEDGARTGERPPTLLFGLPGNPVSTFVTFELFVRPAIRRLAGHRDDDLFRPVDRGVLGDPVTKSSGRRAFVRVTRGARRARARRGATIAAACTRAWPAAPGGQGSHVLSALADRRRPGGHPRGRRQPARRRRGGALVARPRLTRSRAVVMPAILGS